MDKLRKYLGNDCVQIINELFEKLEYILPDYRYIRIINGRESIYIQDFETKKILYMTPCYFIPNTIQENLYRKIYNIFYFELKNRVIRQLKDKYKCRLYNSCNVGIYIIDIINCRTLCECKEAIDVLSTEDYQTLYSDAMDIWNNRHNDDEWYKHKDSYEKMFEALNINDNYQISTNNNDKYAATNNILLNKNKKRIQLINIMKNILKLNIYNDEPFKKLDKLQTLWGACDIADTVMSQYIVRNDYHGIFSYLEYYENIFTKINDTITKDGAYHI